MIQVPNFIESPYLIIDEKGWRLKEDAPEELKKEFEEYMEMINNSHIEEQS